jgi:hypothetical protein
MLFVAARAIAGAASTAALVASMARRVNRYDVMVQLPV